MAIYVDAAKHPFRGKRYCYMLTNGDTTELLAFARSIGLHTDWIQRAGMIWEHFEVCPFDDCYEEGDEE
jgi:hypothetical protein